jgi:hypothetical protein
MRIISAARRWRRNSKDRGKLPAQSRLGWMPAITSRRPSSTGLARRGYHDGFGAEDPVLRVDDAGGKVRSRVRRRVPAKRIGRFEETPFDAVNARRLLYRARQFAHASAAFVGGPRPSHICFVLCFQVDAGGSRALSCRRRMTGTRRRFREERRRHKTGARRVPKRRVAAPPNPAQWRPTFAWPHSINR